MSHSNSDSYNHRIQQPNFTPIPNVVMDYWMHMLDHCTSCVLIFLCRKTLGWQKKRDCLSLKKIEIGLNMSRNRVIKSIKILEDYGLIKKEEHFNEFGDQDPNTYEVIIHEEVVHEENHPVHAVNHGGSARDELGVVHGVNPQKKDIQKKREIDIRKPHGSHVKLSDEEYANLCSKESKEKVDEILNEINDHCVNNRPKGYEDYCAAFRTFLRNKNKQQGKNNGNANKGKSNKGKTPNPTGYFVNGVRVE